MRRAPITTTTTSSGTAAAAAAAAADDIYISALEREPIVQKIAAILESFYSNRNDPMTKKGIYIYGPAGAGKTALVYAILRRLKYDVVKYDTGDVRNKALIETITKHNMSDRNVLSMMRGEKGKIVVLMDEIDGMNNGDKGGITSLIKLIRQKKNKKQKNEDSTMNPVICIGSYFVDKKIRELMKVCETFELPRPTDAQMSALLARLGAAPALADIVPYCRGDLRKMRVFMNFHSAAPALFSKHSQTILQNAAFIDNVKTITARLFSPPAPAIQEHNTVMNDKDRTIVALLWHENVISFLPRGARGVQLYARILPNICFSDYMDRITFQNQIWQFNEMTSLIKTFYSNFILASAAAPARAPAAADAIRFTKVLTKYSTEYNNQLFVFGLCQKLLLEPADLFCFFQWLRAGARGADLGKIEAALEHVGISKIFIKRIYRYMDVAVRASAAAAATEDEFAAAAEDESGDEDDYDSE